MAVTITTLEAKARINRDAWNADKAAILSDIQGLSQQLDQFSSRTAAARSAPSRAQAATQAAPDAQPLNQAADATTRLSRAQREATDPAFAMAQAINRAQRDVSLYTRTMGEAHPVTLQARSSLEALQRSAGSGAQPVLTLSQHLRNLTQQITTSGGAAQDFGRGILQSFGGISLIAGGAAAAGAAVAGLVQQIASLTAELIRSGVAGNASFEQFQVGFKVLLGGADAAQARIKELSDFAQHTPFNLPEVVQADRVLQTFGGNVLATGKNLTLVGDIASGTNQRFADVAMWIGRAYDALQSGRPWGEAAMRLQEMGALSGQARARLEAMQASGASGQQIWAAFNQEMSRFNGLMDAQSHTLAGLSSNWQDLQMQFQRTATVPLANQLKQFLTVATSEPGQKAVNQAATDTANVFSTLLPLGILTATESIKPLTGALKSLTDIMHLFGAGAEAATTDMYTFGHSAFTGIVRDVNGLVDALGRVAPQSTAAAQAYGASIRQMQTAARGGEGGPRDQRAEIGGFNAPPPPGFKSWSEYNQWSSARNSIIDQTNAAIQNANVAKQQAGDQQYLAAQLQAQNAQAQASAAMDRLKLTDSTFLQGQVSSEITSTQLQTAIDRIKVGNRQLQDATIQSEIAQSQVNAAMNRVRANNQSLIAAGIDADVASTQAQTAITKAQGNSQAFINAQVQAEQAQRDTQNKLDIARKAAGLIDETAEEKRQHERQITRVEFVKQQAEDAASIIKAGIDSITNLQSVHVPTNIDNKIGQLVGFEDKVIAAEQQIASKFTKDQITQLYSFSQAASEGMGYFATGVTALGQVSTLRLPDASQVERVLAQADGIVKQVNKTAATYKTEDIVQAGVYAEQASKITGFLSSTADAFAKLLPQRTDIRGQINLFFENLNHALRDFSIYSKSFKAYATDTARDIADNVGAVMDNLNKALEPLTKFNDLLNLDDSTIDLGFASIERALGRFSQLADSPMLQGTKLDKLKTASDALGSVFTGLKTMTDTLMGLTSLADPTGTIDFGSDLDTFFFQSVPQYADSWAAAMDRIGTTSEVAGNRVHTALGTPNARGGAGAGGGNSYTVIIDGNSHQLSGRAGSLLHQFFDELALTSGGVPVG